MLGFDSFIAGIGDLLGSASAQTFLMIASDFSSACPFPLEEVRLFGCCLMKSRRWVGALRFLAAPLCGVTESAGGPQSK